MILVSTDSLQRSGPDLPTYRRLLPTARLRLTTTRLHPLTLLTTTRLHPLTLLRAHLDTLQTMAVDNVARV
jgi:hypothetical protein